jgi:biopolymer transport protein ExbD
MMLDDELDNPLRQARKGKKYQKEGIVMDMNAMVDLAFLLLTFFMLTTTMLKPKAIELVMPVPDNEDEELIETLEIKESRAITIIPLSDERLYYYIGFSKAEAIETNYGKDGIRKILLEHQSNTTDPIAIIKPHPESIYENLIELIDEMNITRIDRYAIDKFGESELQLLLKKGIAL